MKTKNSKRINIFIGILSLGISGFAFHFAKAWTEPATPPPASNVGAPVTTGGTPQVKTGSFGVGSSMSVLGGFAAGASDSINLYRSADNHLTIQTTLDGQPLGTYGGDNENRLLLQPLVGNVGIGTTSPSQKLDVNGNIAMQGKRAFNAYDSWLRINENNDFTSGIYAGTGILRTDGQLQVGANGSAFRAQTDGNVYAAGTVFANGQALCQVDGTNCKLQPGDNLGNGVAGVGVDLNMSNNQIYSVSKATIGRTDFDYVPSGANWNYTLQLNAQDTSSIGFHDAGQNVGSIRFKNNLFTIGADDGWGIANTYLAGNVGIGTSTPGYKLDINGGMNAAGGARLSNIAVGASPFGILPFAYESIQFPSGNNLRINAGSTEVAMFGSDGNSYFRGTAFANGQALCQVDGTNCPTNNGLKLDAWQGNHYSGSDGSEYATIFRDTNDGAYYLDPNGISNLNNVTAGSGANGNWAALNAGGPYSINAKGSIYSYDSMCVGNNSGSCDSSGGVVIGKANTSATTNITTGTSFFNGNVGIGITIPSDKLDVIGGDVRIGLALQSSKLIMNTNVLHSGASVDVWGSNFGVYGVSTNTGVYGSGNNGVMAYGGNYGVYASASTIGVQGTANLIGVVAYGDSSYGIDATSNTGIGGYFSSSSGPALVTGTGKVGIGLNTPAYNLDVTGDINFSGVLRKNGASLAPIVCKKHYASYGPASAGTYGTSFAAADCGGTLPDANYVGTIKRLEECGGAATLRVLDAGDSAAGYNGPGITFYGSVCGGTADFEAVYVRK